ncbi:MAG: serine/threonine-protein kinase, partial [Myxococcota bacterium]
MSEEDTLLKSGDRVLGDYVILEEIGRGGFGVVYRAVQEPIGRHVAIKTLRPNPHDIPGYDFAEAFRREARHTSRLKHPNTITVHAYGETDNGVLCLVTEFLEGETLYHRLWRRGPMSQETCIQITRQIAKSLAEAHENGIIHGDLKPANIFLCNLHGEQDFVKVLDFGITKLIGEVDPAGLGTPEYMSPEQFSGQPLLAASDVYSLGLLMYEMVVGQRPFLDEDTQKLARRHILEPLPPMPREIEQSPLGYAIRTACAKEPAERFENGGVMVEVLTHMSNGGNVFNASSGLMRAIPDMPPQPAVSESPSAAAVEPTAPSEPSPEPEAQMSVGLSAPEPARSTLYRNLLVMVGRHDDRARLVNDVEQVIEKGISQWILLGGAAGM